MKLIIQAIFVLLYLNAKFVIAEEVEELNLARCIFLATSSHPAGIPASSASRTYEKDLDEAGKCNIIKLNNGCYILSKDINSEALFVGLLKEDCKDESKTIKGSFNVGKSFVEVEVKPEPLYYDPPSFLEVFLLDEKIVPEKETREKYNGLVNEVADLLKASDQLQFYSSNSCKLKTVRERNLSNTTTIEHKTSPEIRKMINDYAKKATLIKIAELNMNCYSLTQSVSGKGTKNMYGDITYFEFMHQGSMSGPSDDRYLEEMSLDSLFFKKFVEACGQFFGGAEGLRKELSACPKSKKITPTTEKSKGNSTGSEATKAN